jgi:hypothetical protein
MSSGSEGCKEKEVKAVLLNVIIIGKTALLGPQPSLENSASFVYFQFQEKRAKAVPLRNNKVTV